MYIKYQKKNLLLRKESCGDNRPLLIKHTALTIKAVILEELRVRKKNIPLEFSNRYGYYHHNLLRAIFKQKHGNNGFNNSHLKAISKNLTFF